MSTTETISPHRQMSGGRGMSDEKPNLFKQDAKQPSSEVRNSESEPRVFTHGLHRLQHVSFDSPVRFMMYSEAAAAFISLHSDGTVSLYNPEGHKQISSARLPFMGLTDAKLSDYLVGWGPGSVFTLLDRELRPLEVGHDALDIRVCEASEHATELVTAGEGNVCVWSVFLMRCKVKIQEGLQKDTFTLMALAPPQSDRPHRAFVVSRRDVTVVDLDTGKVLEKRRNLCIQNITAIVYCSQLDCLITASLERSIKVWGPDWELHVTFEGRSGVVNSLFYCPVLGMLLSAYDDCTICCWNVEEGDLIECIDTEQNTPPLCVGSNKKGDTFFTFSHRGVDFWSIRNLYTLHCKLTEDKQAPLRQIKVSLFPAPYPTRILCVSGDSDIVLVAAKTGAVLTSFKAKQRIVCADYCLHKEILVALTETGTVLQANTLTNPITLMKEWKGSGQRPWHRREYVIEKDAQNLQTPGPACCLVLYSSVAKAETALDQWTILQDCRGWTKRPTLHEPQNKFLIILGQSGGCVSVLDIGNGKVVYRKPAHSGQRVTSLQVYPEKDYLLSTGEDMTVVVWKVFPYGEQCLSQHLSVHCGQPQVNLAVLGPQLALTFQQPDSGIYSLMHFNLLNQTETGPPTKEGHSDHFTGLCVCPDLEVHVSSSRDRTLLIWDENNHLISKLQLNAVPQCLAYGRFGAELYLGIKGNLYRLDFATSLPQTYQQMFHYIYFDEPPPDLPIMQSQRRCSKTKNESGDKDEDEVLPAITNNLLLTEDMSRLQNRESLEIWNMDLAAVLQGSVQCHKEKPLSTKETRNQAFECYMKILYRFPLEIKIDSEDSFEEDELSFYLEPYEDTPPAEPEDELHEPKPKSKSKKSVVGKNMEKMAKTKLVIPKIPVKIKPKPSDVPTEPVIAEKIKSQGPPTPRPSTSTATTPVRPRTSTPAPQPEPLPEVPSFVKQFADADWFKEISADKKRNSSSLSPKDLYLELLASLTTSDAPSKIKILAALKALHNQGLIHNIDHLYKKLIDLVQKLVTADISPLDQAVLVKMLNLLVNLKPVSYGLMKQLLTLLAFKKLGLRDTLLRVLKVLGVKEAERWLWPELESWDSELQDQSDVWKSLYGRVDCWLELWTTKFMLHKRYRTPKLKQSAISVVDVLNYFCKVQKDEYRTARCRALDNRNNTVLLPLYDWSSQPILRLGETYCMTRIPRQPGIILPPLRSRPFLTHFPNYIYLPIPQITLSPFHTYSEEDWVKTWAQRYFVHQQSLVEYYR